MVAEVAAIDPTMLGLLRGGEMREARAYWRDELHGMTYLEHARHLLAAGVIDPVTAEDQLSMPLDYDDAPESRKPGGPTWL